MAQSSVDIEKQMAVLAKKLEETKKEEKKLEETKKEDKSVSMSNDMILMETDLSMSNDMIQMIAIMMKDQVAAARRFEELLPRVQKMVGSASVNGQAFLVPIGDKGHVLSVVDIPSSLGGMGLEAVLQGGDGFEVDLTGTDYHEDTGYRCVYGNPTDDELVAHIVKAWTEIKKCCDAASAK